MTFNHRPNFVTQSADRRKVSVEACIIAAIADGPKNLHGIRWFVHAQPGFEWVMASFIAETVARLCREKRLVMTFRPLRSIADYELPAFAMDPILQMQKRRELNSERELRLIASIDWPKWFHVPNRNDLLPFARNYPLDAGRSIHL